MNTQFQSELTVFLLSVAFIITGLPILDMARGKLKSSYPHIILFIAITIAYILAIIFFAKSF